MYENGYDLKKTMEQIRKNNKGYVSQENGGNCQYRSDDGNACLVGCFIPDDKYQDIMEETEALTVIEDYDLANFMPMNVFVMNELQELHDNELEYIRGSENFYTTIEKWLINRALPLHQRT